MPGYLTEPSSIASGIANVPAGNIAANNVQSAINELDTEKAPATGIAQSAVTNLVSDLSSKAPLSSPTFTGTMSASVANISSNLTVNTNTLFVDTINNRVGVGTTSPSFPLEINSASAAATGISNALKIKQPSDGGVGVTFSNAVADLARINAEVEGTGSSTDESSLTFYTAINGSLSKRMTLDSNGQLFTQLKYLNVANGDATIRQYLYANFSLSQNTSINLIRNSSSYSDIFFYFTLKAFHGSRSYTSFFGNFGGYGGNFSSAGAAGAVSITFENISAGFGRLRATAGSLPGGTPATVFISGLVFQGDGVIVENGVLYGN